MNKKSNFFLFILLFSYFCSLNLNTVLAATSITAVTQRPWIIDDAGNLKSETVLTINQSGSLSNAWVKITVTGEAAYMESIGSLSAGNNSKTIHVLELNNDGDNVTFQIYDNSGGTGTPLAADTRSQKKIRHWKVYVAHDMHLDVGYTDYQEYLKDTKWPGFLDNAAQYVSDTNSWSNDDKFRYPVEGSYEIYDGAWNVRSADWIETLKSNIAAGRITYPAAFFNVCYEALGTEELARFTYFSQRHLKDMLGLPSNGHSYQSDNPGLSWGAVDALVNAGFKYYSFRFNPDHNIWDRSKYPYIFYMLGKNPLNKLMIYDGPHYGDDEMDFQNADSNVTFNNCTTKIMNYHTSGYPYDAIIENFTYNRQDNGGINNNVRNNIKNLNAKTDSSGRDYVYPKFINSTVHDFFGYVEANFAASIPSYKGTVENWWNFGAASTAYETGLNKANHEKLPAAEIFATFANKVVANTKYPYENLATAYKNMILYDEHTWGPASSACDDQWVWKRNTALQSETISNKVLGDSLTAINTLIPTIAQTIVVYNALSFSRSDLVTVQQASLPSHFDLTDIETGAAVKYQKLSDGNVVFIAGNVPGTGYKCFRVTSRADDPSFSTSIIATSNTIENNYFKVTFDGTGSISSILDKQNGNREMVDNTAPYQMNQFIYKQSNNGTYYTIGSAALSSSTGCIMGTMSADGGTTGVDSMKRNVILYDSIPRIDLVNDVVKSAAPSPINSVFEEGFFAFPLNVSNFMLRHEMPAGDVRPHVTSNINDPNTEQYYTSCPNFYTVNRWINASNQSDYGIILSPVNAPIVQYGQLWFHAMNYDYNTTKPWVYSEVFDNNWKTNFQITQPGKVSFKYSLKSHTGADWKAGRADRFGAEVCNELKSSLISGAQSGSYSGTKGQFIGIDKDNVILTTAKIAEACGEGVILRFNETKGVDTTVTVDLSWLTPSSATETDLVENDLSAMTITNNTISFTINGYGWKTVRVKSGTAPAQVTGVTATMNASGTQVAWTSLSDSSLAYYEVFRGTTSGFTAGSGSYLATVSANHYYDSQVKTGLTRTFYYKVRAARAGLKGSPSAAAQAISGTITDTAAPSAPANLKGTALYGNRVSLTWEPSADNLYVKGYKVYRNGSEIKDVDVVLNSFLDTGTASGGSYDYYVKAYDSASNLSSASNTITVLTAGGPTPIPGNIAPQASTFSASSEYSSNFSAAKVADNIIGVQDSGEWASNGEVNPWVRMDWSANKTINKIVLFDRNNLTDDVNGGTLSFSDSSTVNVTGIPKDGTAKEVTFTNKTITWVKFQVGGGNGMNVGLSEMQVFEVAGATPTPTPTPTPTLPPGITMVDDDDPNAVYTGTWDDNHNAFERYNNTEHYTNTTNSYYQFTFTGTEIRLVGTREPNRGMSDVYIDNVFDTTVDQYSATTLFQQEIYFKTGLTSGSHTIKVVCKGQKNVSATNYYICIDAFKYSNSGYVQANLSSYYNLDGFSYDTNRTDGAYDPGASPTSCYPADLLNGNPFYDGTPYTLGPKNDGANNAIRGTGQTISLPQGQYLSIRLLGSATNGDQAGTFRINYTDATYTDISVTEKDWCTSNTSGQMVVQTMDHRHQGSADQTINNYVFAYYLTPAAGKTVSGLVLPNNTNIHVLAITLAPSSGSTPTPTPTTGATATPTPTPTLTPTPAGLAGYWKFDETSGTTAADSSGNGNTGALSGGGTWTTGKVSGALSFDGTDDKVTVNDNATLDLTAFTVAMWVYMDALPASGQFYATAVKGVDGTENYELLIGHPNAGNIHFPIKFSDGTRSQDSNTTQLTAGSWKHLVLTYDGASARIYIDAVLDYTMTYNKTPAVNSNTLVIGNEGTSSRYFKGKMDEVRVYNRALTQQEITGLYNYTGN